mmetsp:Transcript_17561/g.49593  ORF Transcript_17561/g.49593 Transcript_17561/m.49593 type:complete len:115 (+) Transcript_17561:354-698(+)
MKRMVDETAHCKDGLTLNICLSYGSRGEIVNATKSLCECKEEITEENLSKHMLLNDPDLLIRTSGEMRISNFLLWQLAYSELFFIDKAWPAIEKDDLLHVIRSFALGRNRRFGK